MTRGTLLKPSGRFEPLKQEFLSLPDDWPCEPDLQPAPATKVFLDSSQSIITRNHSPDLGFDFSINAYRGCEHGCAYCYARPTHEYLGLSPGLDFETRIFVKLNAPALLRRHFEAKRWQPAVIMMSGITDCYQPLERKLKLTRQLLEVFREYQNPASIITKNHLITRDLDLLKDLAKLQLVQVTLSLTTLDHRLAGALEPRTSRPEFRLRAIRELREAGVPVGVNLAPVIPGLNDHEIPAILKAAADAGAQNAMFGMLRLPYGVAEIFSDWLEKNAQLQKEKILHRIREVRGNKLNDSRFGRRLRGEGQYAKQIEKLFQTHSRKWGLNHPRVPLSRHHFQRKQLDFKI